MRVRKAIILAVPTLVLASACGHTPGAAFQVGERTVTRDTVNQVVDAACGVPNQTKAARSQQVWTFVNAMLNATIENAYGDHVKATYDGSTLQSELGQYDASIGSLPKKDQSVVRDFLTQQIKGALIVQSVGKKALSDKGVASPTPEEVTNAGNAAAQKWARAQGIRVDPRYNPGRSSQAGAGDGSISKAVSSYAKAAESGSNKASYLSQLPADQLCG